LTAICLTGVNGHLHAAVLRATGIAVVRRNGFALTATRRPQARAVNPVVSQHVGSRARPTLAQPHAIAVLPHGIGLAEQPYYGVRILVQAARQVLQVGAGAGLYGVGIEVVQQSAVERHNDALANSRDGSAGHVLLKLLGLLVHLVTDNRARCTTQHGADDRTASGASGLVTDRKSVV